MTMEMIPALGILVLMIVLIMSDKMPLAHRHCLRVYCWLYRDFRPFNRLCRIRQSKRGDDCRVYGGHGGATKPGLSATLNLR